MVQFRTNRSHLRTCICFHRNGVRTM